MYILNNIIELLSRRGKTQKNLCDYLGISNNVFTDWKAGRNSSYKKYLPEIANFLGVSIDFLLNKESPKEEPERKILGAGGMTEEGKTAVIEAIGAEQALNEQIMQKKIALRDKIRDANLTMDQLIKIEYVISAIIDEK